MLQAQMRLIPLPLMAAAMMFAAAPRPAAAQSPASVVSEALAEIQLRALGPVDSQVSPTTGLVTFLSTEPGRPVPGRLPASAAADARARDFLDAHGATFGIANANNLILERVSEPDEVGIEHVRYRQTYGGMLVTGGALTVHLRGGDIVAVNAKTLGPAGFQGLAGPDLPGPVLSAPEAQEAVRRFLAGALGVTDAQLSEPRLELLNRGLLEGRASFTQLAWFVQAFKTDLRQLVWVDATGGKVLLSFSQLTDARDREIYDADDPGDGVFNSLPGALVRVEGGAPTGDADADAAYEYSGDTYDYFFDIHSRDSYDGMGSKLKSSVHFCPTAGSCPYINAFWNGVQMVYGEGFAAADDVAAHELTHAVTEQSAELFYYMQSGALNESFSDIFGETVDLTNTGGTDTPAVRWQIGEDIPGIGAIRNMMDPMLFADPGKMSDTEAVVCGDSYQVDQGGVHHNSGVPNHAFALMVDGGSYNGFSVTGIGLTKAGKIQYRALTEYLTSASDFLDNYHALKQSCRDLIGIAGITAADCSEVAKALDAVEMSDVWPCTPTQAAPPAFCPVGQAPTIWHYEDVESSVVTPCPSNGVLNSWCVNGPASLLGSFATSGNKSYWGYDQPVAGSMSLTVAPPGTLPASARMQFNHSFGFENTGTSYWDGGVVEYSTNGGTSWSDGGSLIAGGQAYGGTIFPGFGNPLGGQSAFVGESWGYTSSQLDLSSLPTGSFRYRFRVGTDASVDDYGWFVDDIRIYSCSVCQIDRALNVAYKGTASLYQALHSVTAESGFIVDFTDSVTFEVGSGGFIALGNGFEVKPGGHFEARVTPGLTCN